MKEDEGDAEFAPPSEESSDEEEALEIDPQEIALLSGDYEVYDIHGHVTVVHGPELSKAEEEKKETEVVKLAKEDPRYNQATANRQLRFNVIINRAVGQLQTSTLMISVIDFISRKKLASTRSRLSWTSQTAGKALLRFLRTCQRSWSAK